MSSAGQFPRIDLRASPLNRGALERITAHLESGGLVAYPTETVYGFGCALQPGALARLARLKDRSAKAPFLLLIPDESAVEDLRWSPAARELADVFWPGALTLVLEDPSGSYPSEVRGPSGGVAVRRTPHPVAGAVVEALEAPLTSTSANPPGGEPATTADEAAEAARVVGAVGDELWILDGGRLPPSPPSTIVDLTGDEIRVIREGAVPARRLACTRAGGPTQ